MSKAKETENLEIVLKQIEAFNAKDIEGCLKYWADDLKVIVLPEEKVVFSSKQEVREHLQKQFSGEKGPITKILKKETDNSYVYLLEEKTRADNSTIKANFTYYIEGDLINTMWGKPVEE